MKLENVLVLLFVLTSYGCSSTDDNTPEEPKVYSDETNRAFEMIERGYPKWEEHKAAPAKIAAPQYVQPSVQEQQAIKKTITMPKAKTTASRVSSAKLIELNQNLAFYCMKHRKDPTFKNDEKKCMDYVGVILDQCQKQNHKSHSYLLACVKKKLNRK